MDAHRFDILARRFTVRLSRRSGLALLGILGLRGLAASDPAAAKKKRRRKRKRKRNRCPAGLVACIGQCGLPNLATGCLLTSATCCSNRCFADLCIPCPGKPCDSDDDCCDGLRCIDTNDPNAGFTCGGCLHGSIGTCQNADDCCSAECNNGLCGSHLGERCATGLDCLGFTHGVPACVAGKCACGTECCADTDCSSPEECRDGTCTCPTECCSDDDCGLIEECVDGKCQAQTGG